MPSLESKFSPAKTVVLLPVFNDWDAVAKVVSRLDSVLDARWRPFSIVIVDDCSLEAAPVDLGSTLKEVEDLVVLRLRRNLGHQRAIAVGVTYVAAKLHPSVLVVMDGDGEDRPEDVPRLLDEVARTDFAAVVFAERTKRFEPLWFRISYQTYRLVHRVMTGIPVKVGNFSAVPARHLASLGAVSELWNHYAAAVFKARLPMRTVPLSRGVRLGGHSKMNFVGLIVHGLSAISVFGETAGVRLLLVLLPITAMTLLILVAAVSFVSVPLRAVLVIAMLALMLMQIAVPAIGSLFFFLHTRNTASFLPVRDYHWFVDTVTAVRSRESAIAVHRE